MVRTGQTPEIHVRPDAKQYILGKRQSMHTLFQDAVSPIIDSTDRC